MSLELNLKHEEVKEIFYGLIKEADIFMENMVWMDKLGVYDEELLKVKSSTFPAWATRNSAVCPMSATAPPTT